MTEERARDLSRQIVNAWSLTLHVSAEQELTLADLRRLEALIGATLKDLREGP